MSKRDHVDGKGKKDKKYRKPKNRIPQEDRRGSRGEERQLLKNRYRSLEDAEKLWDDDEDFNGVDTDFVDDYGFDDER